MLSRAPEARSTSAFVSSPRVGIVLLLLGGAACAYGTEIEGAGGLGGSAGVGVPSGGSQSAGQGYNSQSSTHAVASSASATKASSASSTASTTASSSGSGMPNCNAVALNSCQAADDIGSVAGDDGGTVSDSGSGSRWVKAHVTEEDGSIFESDMSYTVTLTASAGVQYGLFVHPGPDDSGPDCNAAPLQGGGGANQSVHDGWDDSQGIGGEDNSRWLSIEVRWISGDCTLPWSLTVSGGT